MKIFMSALALALVMSLGVVPAVAQVESKVVRDWSGECDDKHACMATASGEGGMAMGGTGYRLRFSRQNGESSAWAMRFLLKNVPQPKRAMAISIDGGEAVSFFEGYGYLRDIDGITFGMGGGADLSRLFAAVKKGSKLTLSYETQEGTTQKEAFSLSGLAAVLLWIDDRQRRVGKSTDISFPAGIEGEARFTAKKDILDKIEARVKFDCLLPPKDSDVESYHLPGGLALHIAQCFQGPYNTTQLYFVQQPSDLQLLYFADYNESWTGTNQLFNSYFDPKTGSLGAYYKGVGVGGCGSSGQWVWSGYSFKLTEFTAWPDCDNPRGDGDWPVLYRYQSK